MDLNTRSGAEAFSTAIGVFTLLHANSRPRPASTSSPADWRFSSGNRSDSVNGRSRVVMLEST